MKGIIFTLFLYFFNFTLQAQTLKGQFLKQGGQTIQLTGFNYLDEVVLSESKIDSLGRFSVSFPKDYHGMGILSTQDKSSMIVALTEPVITIAGKSLKDTESIRFINSPKNVQLAAFIAQNTQNGQAHQAWNYLATLYQKQPYLKKQTEVEQQIKKEISRINKADEKELLSFPATDYLRWFLPQRIAINDLATIVKTDRKRIPQTIEYFRSINFDNPNFKTSGHLKTLLEGHYFLLGNSEKKQDSIVFQMNKSTDCIVNSLKNNPDLLGKVTNHLFVYLENQSFFKAAAYLANRVLNDNTCSIDSKVSNRFEKYRRLKEGNIAPDIALSATKKLSEIGKNIVLIFGASWCPHCQEELKSIHKYYAQWQQNNRNVEVVYMSIDTDKDLFAKTYWSTPWPTYCDYRGWEGKAAKDFAIYATPTYFLLDKNLKIIKHGTSPAHVDAVVNAYFKK